MSTPLRSLKRELAEPGIVGRLAVLCKCAGTKERCVHCEACGYFDSLLIVIKEAHRVLSRRTSAAEREIARDICAAAIADLEGHPDA